jgi:lysozyme family protein
MTTFEQALEFVFAHEGCFSDDPADSGGLTRWGISQKNHPDVDIRNLTQEQATKIYQSEYWDACKCGEMPPALAFVLFDMAVNQGAGVAVRDLQKLLNVKVDGIIGAETMAMIGLLSDIGVEKMVISLTTERVYRYAALGKIGYMRGWAKRAIECMTEALEI